MTDSRAGTSKASGTNAFDLIRLLAALAVVVQHATVHLDDRFLWAAPHGGWWFYDGVPAFFIISGFFVYRSALSFRRRNRSTTEYLFNRALRVIPAIWVYLAITVSVLLVVGAVSPSRLLTLDGFLWVASTLALVPVYSPEILDGFGIGVINGSLWTIPVEVSFYIALPLVLVPLALHSRRLATVVTAAVVLIGMSLSVALGDSLVGKLLGVSFLPHLGFFALGMAWHDLWGKWNPRTWYVLPAAITYGLLAWARGAAGDVAVMPLTLAAAFPLSLVVMIVGHRGPVWAGALTQRLGDLSFGTYIWHMPIINLMLWAGWSRLPDGTAPLVAVVLTLAAAWCSWHLIEKPVLARKRHSSRERRAPESARTGQAERSQRVS